MADLYSKIEIEYVWLKEPTQLQKCVCCEETVYSDAYRLYIMFSMHEGRTRLRGWKSALCLCASCNELIHN